MNTELFNLRPINSPRLDGVMLQRAITRIGKITEGWESGTTSSFADLLDDFRNRFRSGLLKGKSLEECTNVRRREWLLLSLYLIDLAAEESRSWLPQLDNNVILSILGDKPNAIRKHYRRLATQLYFTHFDKELLPCLEQLSWLLKLSWSAASSEKLDPVSKVWAKNAEILFSINAPDKLAELWQVGMTVSDLADTYHIHKGGLFRKRLMESLIFSRLRRLPLGNTDHELNNLVIAAKDHKFSTGLRLGSAAVQILIRRSLLENSSVVPDAWCEQLVSFSCDPRVPNIDMQEKWWRWATSTEKDVAIRALSKLSLEEFIKLLEQSLRGTEAEHQFPARSKFLLNLFNTGVVSEARLVVHRDLNNTLDKSIRKALMPSWVRGGGNKTSFICLRCIDNIFLIEGTHNFGLRGFTGKGNYQVKKFWESEPREYDDVSFRIHKTKCPIYIHHQGAWVWKFVSQLRDRNIEWRGIC